MKAEDIAKYLGVGKNAVYQLAKSGALPSYRIGRKMRFTREDADAFLANSHTAASEPAHDASADSEPLPHVCQNGDSNPSLAEAAAFGIVPGDPFVIAGNDISADVITHALNESGIPASHLNCESYTALVNLYAGKATAAVVGLYDQSTNGYNIPYVRRLTPGVSVKVIRLYARSQGLIVAKGNPKKISSWGSLLREGVRLANRMKGSDSRILLDEKLRAMEVRCETLEGYDERVFAGTSAVKIVARGYADVTVGTAREAQKSAGVQFVPLQTEWVDIVIRKTPESLPIIRSLGELLASQRMRADLQMFEPDDLSKLGCVIFET